MTRKLKAPKSTRSLEIAFLFITILLSCDSKSQREGEKEISHDKKNSHAYGTSETWIKEHKIECDKGVLDSCRKLGHYWKGDGDSQSTKYFQRDLVKARDYFYKACGGTDKKNRSRLTACYWLADMIRNGEGGYGNPDKAMTLFKEICDLGYGMGCLEYGIEVYKRNNDLSKGKLYMKRACELKAPLACPGVTFGLSWKDKQRWKMIQILRGDEN